MFGSPQLLTDKQVKTIAATSDFICIEKAHGLKEVGAAELGAKHEIARFKQANPRTRALFLFQCSACLAVHDLHPGAPIWGDSR
jgi:hypothetical protein